MCSISNLISTIEKEVVSNPNYQMIDNFVFLNLFGVIYFLKEVLVANGRLSLIPMPQTEEHNYRFPNGKTLEGHVMTLNDLYEILLLQTANFSVGLGSFNMLTIDLGYKIGRISFNRDRLYLTATDPESWS